MDRLYNVTIEYLGLKKRNKFSQSTIYLGKDGALLVMDGNGKSVRFMAQDCKVEQISANSIILRGYTDKPQHITAYCVYANAKPETTPEPEPEPIRFNGLEWKVGPDDGMNWDEAKEWVDGLGDDWRMPTLEELGELWDTGITSDNWGPFGDGGWWVWSGEVYDSSSAWYFNFDSGGEYWYTRSNSADGFRAFAVRT